MRTSAASKPQPATSDIKVSKYVERFLQKIEVSPDGHWLFTGARSGNGYGVCSVEGRKVQLAHRASWDFFVDDLPGEGFVIGHAGGCPRNCVRPEHLSVITHAQNQLQRITDGTMYVPRRKSVKATPEEIADIRRRASLGETGYAISKVWNRSETYIAKVLSGRLHDPKKPAKPKKIVKMPKRKPVASAGASVLKAVA